MTGAENREPYGGVWRIDDNGSVVVVAEWATAADAEAWLVANEREFPR